MQLISIHLMLRFINLWILIKWKRHYFNTSHVTVYLMGKKLTKRLQRNFNTSHVTVYRASVLQSQTLYHDFNTSHVTVYLQYVIHAEEKHVNFNTSHVTVYRVSFLWGAWGTGISIHLMLRFIVYSDEGYDLPPLFQYISCYGLSAKNISFRKI